MFCHITRLISKKNSLATALLILACLGAQVSAQTKHAGKTWIATDFPGQNQKYGTIEQAKRWALCAATLDLYADVLESNGGKTNTTKLLRDIANGAEVSIMAVFLASVLTEAEKLPQDQIIGLLSAKMEYANGASKDYPEAQRTYLLAVLENTNNKVQFALDLDASAGDCLSKEVLTTQESYINLMREYAMILDAGQRRGEKNK